MHEFEVLTGVFLKGSPLMVPVSERDKLLSVYTIVKREGRWTRISFWRALYLTTNGFLEVCPLDDHGFFIESESTFYVESVVPDDYRDMLALLKGEYTYRDRLKTFQEFADSYDREIEY